MVRKTIIGLVVFVVVATIGIWIAAKLSGSSTDSSRRAAPDLSLKKDPWDGRGSWAYGLDFVRAGQTISLVSADYQNLNLPRASAAITLRVLPRSATARRPAWLKRSNFYLRTRSNRRLYVAKKRGFSLSRATTGVYTVRLGFSRLPSAALGQPTGPGCQGAGLGPLTLAMRLPRGTVQVVLVSSDPPAGHCLAESLPAPPAKPKPKGTKTTKRCRGKGKRRSCRITTTKQAQRCRGKGKRRSCRQTVTVTVRLCRRSGTKSCRRLSRTVIRRRCKGKKLRCRTVSRKKSGRR